MKINDSKVKAGANPTFYPSPLSLWGMDPQPSPRPSRPFPGANPTPYP
jgi:hypothetical protein